MDDGPVLIAAQAHDEVAGALRNVLTVAWAGRDAIAAGDLERAAKVQAWVVGELEALLARLCRCPKQCRCGCAGSGTGRFVDVEG